MSLLNLHLDESKLNRMNLQDKSTEIVAALIVAILTALIAYFKKLPAYIIKKRAEKRRRRLEITQLAAVKAGNKINNIIDQLGNDTGALYVHIIRYHNGGYPLEVGHALNMTVEWEEPGHSCDGCMTQCSMYKKVPRVQHQWKGQPVTGNWFDIIEHTLNNKTECTTIPIENMDDEHADLWKTYNIALFKEVFIKHTELGFYTLGLSFCRRTKDIDVADGLMVHAAGQLNKYL